jgi:CheY-like chemotaxis protein
VEKIRILYAEGYDLVLFTAKQLLEAEGWEVEVCRDGASVLKKLEGEEHFDLLILDDRLEGSDGGELIRRAKDGASQRPVPVILFTAEQANGGASSPEADACLSKPGGLKDLVPTCRRLLPHAAPRLGPDADGGEPETAAE